MVFSSRFRARDRPRALDERAWLAAEGHSRTARSCRRRACRDRPARPAAPRYSRKSGTAARARHRRPVGAGDFGAGEPSGCESGGECRRNRDTSAALASANLASVECSFPPALGVAASFFVASSLDKARRHRSQSTETEAGTGRRRRFVNRTFRIPGRRCDAAADRTGQAASSASCALLRSTRSQSTSRRFGPAVERVREMFVSPDDHVAAIAAHVTWTPRPGVDAAIVPLELGTERLCAGCGGRGESWAEPCHAARAPASARIRITFRLAVPARRGRRRPLPVRRHTSSPRARPGSKSPSRSPGVTAGTVAFLPACF